MVEEPKKAKFWPGMTSILIFPIHLYQRYISPFIGCHCRYYPTCSQYAEEAIKVHGSRKGLYLALKRLARCHPYVDGGHDPVPESSNS